MKTGLPKMKQAEAVAIPALMLADDNPTMLEMLVETLQTRYNILAAVPNGAAILEQFAALNPNLIILDVSLGDLTGFEVAKRLRDRGCLAKLVFLTVHEEIEFVSAAFDLGVSGYVFKSRITEDLTKTIDIVLDGGRFASVILPAAQ
jgi:DNA-binding NarL/FixJ family response regulator